MTDPARLFSTLVEPLENRMMRTIWRIVRHPEAAEDTLQEVMALLWKRMPRIARHPNPHALILKICMNAAYDTLRRHMRSRERLGLSDIGTESTLQGADSGDPPDRTRENEILRAMGRLPRKQALAVLLRVIQDLPYGEIAQILGCKEVTARIHVSKGRAALRIRLRHLLPRTPGETRP